MTNDYAQARRRGMLALTLQEAFTVAVRLRAKRQVAADAASFRAQIRNLLAAADRDARAHGYDGDTIRLAIYAYVAFLDESVLNSGQPMFATWAQQPLQEAVFGDHVAGETFFKHLGELLARQDSEDLADLLAVYQLCLLLGFRGRYGSNVAGLQSITSMVGEKIRRVRGGPPPLGPDALLPASEVVVVQRDPWVPRLAASAAVSVAVAAVLWIVFYLMLRRDVAGVGILGGTFGS